ncbi:MAG: hypothetical protein QM714_15600 [Nocardioides sp.]|uniref:hypothetical protein n=1 Tax=Nocardioides sp. TaxID=35761 RepID=UPI0039E4073A
MTLWPLWLGLAGAVLIWLMIAAGWVNLAAGIVVALFVGPSVYVAIVIMFFDDTRDR